MNDEKLLKLIKWALKYSVEFISVVGYEPEFEMLTSSDIDILAMMYDKQFEVNEKTPVDTEVLVRFGNEWIHRHFSHMSPIGCEPRFVCFDDGESQWTSSGHSTPWEFCKLADTKGDY